MIPSAAPDRPPILSAWDVHVPHGPGDARPAVQAWLGHVAAGRIGVGAAPSPACAERLARTEVLLLGDARARIW